MSEGALRKALGRLLLAGVVASALLLGGGLGLWAAPQVWRPAPSHTWGPALAGPLEMYAAWLLHAGLWTLMATPVLGVIASLIEYVAERDWPFVAVTLTVLAILTSTVWLALYSST